MNSVTINGVTYQGGRSVVVKNNVVYVDGNRVDHGETKNGILTVQVSGSLESLEADGDVTVTGDVGKMVQAGGDVNCGNVGNTVQCGGDVDCGKVGGTIMAGGDVSHG